MGLIKNIVGAIFGVIGGIFKAVFGIFGIGKKSEYFLEADDADSGNAPQEKLQATAKAEKPAVQESAPAPAPAPKPVPIQPKPEPVGNFATDYLNAPSANRGRRRPGPSLSPFKDLAKDMKLPSGAR